MSLALEERLFGGMLGAVAGDALGLPFEGAPRAWLDADPVEAMTPGGPHGQPRGTWSDDSSLLLCLADSLCCGCDPDDIGSKFLAWWQQGLWTPFGRPFGYGYTVAIAMYKMMVGIPALQAGEDREDCNGNGSLMRTLPVALYFSAERERMLEAAHQVSSITHAHPRAMMCCGVYCLVASCLMEGMDKKEAVETGVRLAAQHYRGNPWDAERQHLERILCADFSALPRSEVRSTGYVVDTLEASLWSLLQGDSFRDCLLRAVNLGDDTDTVGSVTGGLAGVHYGRDGIPQEWLEPLARREDILALCQRFAAAATAQRTA